MQDWPKTLAGCNWERKNLLLFGPSGIGKMHLAAGIAHSLIELGMRVIVLLEVASKSCGDFVKFTCATILVQ